MMARKHFEAIAGIINRLDLSDTISPAMSEQSAHHYLVGNRDTIDILANNIADLFPQENPRFDRERFLKACGVE